MTPPGPLRLKCCTIPYRQGFIEVSRIHDNCVNLESWEVGADCPLDAAAWVSDLDEDKVVANCELELSNAQAKEVARLILAINNGEAFSSANQCSHWRVFSNAKTADKAKAVSDRLTEKMNRDADALTIEPYAKGGHLIIVELTHSCDDWNELVADVLAVAQSIGAQWTLCSQVAEELDITTTHVSVPGIDGITCFCPRPGTPNAA